MKMTLDELKKKFLGSYIHSINVLYVLQEMIDADKMSDPKKFAQDFTCCSNDPSGLDLVKFSVIRSNYGFQP